MKTRLLQMTLVFIVVSGAVSKGAAGATMHLVADAVGGTQGGSITAAPGSTVRVYLALTGGGNLPQTDPAAVWAMDVVVTATTTGASPAFFTGGLNPADKLPSGFVYAAWEVVSGGFSGGWDWMLNPIGVGTPVVEIGAATLNHTIYDTSFPLLGGPPHHTPAGYVDLLFLGGEVTLSLANGTDLGGGDTFVIGQDITILVPEPLTFNLLAVAGVALLRRRRA